MLVSSDALAPPGGLPRGAAWIRAALLALVTLLALPAQGAPRSDDNVQRAREHFQAGKRAYEQQDYGQAIAEFQAGYELEPRPGFLLNMGHAARKMGKLRKARALYKRFLLTDPPRGERQAAEGLLREIDRELGPDAAAPTLIPAAPAPQAGGELGADLTARSPSPDAPAGRFYTRWWFWGAVGAAVATGVAVGLAARRGSAAYESGTWGQVRL